MESIPQNEDLERYLACELIKHDKVNLKDLLQFVTTHVNDPHESLLQLDFSPAPAIVVPPKSLSAIATRMFDVHSVPASLKRKKSLDSDPEPDHKRRASASTLKSPARTQPTISALLNPVLPASLDSFHQNNAPPGPSSCHTHQDQDPGHGRLVANPYSGSYHGQYPELCRSSSRMLNSSPNGFSSIRASPAFYPQPYSAPPSDRAVSRRQSQSSCGPSTPLTSQLRPQSDTLPPQLQLQQPQYTQHQPNYNHQYQRQSLLANQALEYGMQKGSIPGPTYTDTTRSSTPATGTHVPTELGYRTPDRSPEVPDYEVPVNAAQQQQNYLYHDTPPPKPTAGRAMYPPLSSAFTHQSPTPQTSATSGPAAPAESSALSAVPAAVPPAPAPEQRNTQKSTKPSTGRTRGRPKKNKPVEQQPAPPRYIQPKTSPAINQQDPANTGARSTAPFIQPQQQQKSTAPGRRLTGAGTGRSERRKS